jgi:hypothetical protein
MWILKWNCPGEATGHRPDSRLLAQVDCSERSVSALAIYHELTEGNHIWISPLLHLQSGP